MASTDLLFSQLPAPPGGPVEIVFGDDSGIPAGAVELLASGAITGLRGSIVARVATRLGAAGTITGLRGSVVVTYDVNVERPVAATTRNGWQNTQRLRTSQQQRFEQARPTYAAVQAVWQNATHLGAVHQARWQQARQLAAIVHQALQQAQRVASAPTLQRFEDAQRLRVTTQQRLQQARPLATAPTAQRFEDTTRLRHLLRSSFEDATRRQAAARSSFGHGTPLSRVIAAHYEQARKPGPGVSRPVQPPQPEPCYLPTLPAHLVFDDLADSSLPTHLVFVCERHGPGPDPEPGETIVVPIRRVYVTVNSLTLVRVDGAVPIPAYSFGMSLDVDSWTWQWQATLHADALPLITPSANGDPVEVLATINGVPYRLCCEGYTRQRQFANTRISVKGRGRAALLDAPYAPTLNHGNATARTAQQLMGDVLTINGVGIGWAVDFGLTDWLVPGNVWAHQGPYISAILDIAGAAGGYVQPHDTAATLRVLPRYPAAPWAWSTLTPNFELPAAVVSVEGTDWQQKAAYNRVYVAGTSAGVLGDVVRAGTAGEVLAPMVTHPLITHADAARQRGIAELSNTGRQAHLSLRLPVLQETGVIKPGALVRYVDAGTPRLGLVRGTQVEWSAPTLRQVLAVETHV